MSDPKAGWWPEPMTLIFGKAATPTERTADVFAANRSYETRPQEKPIGWASSKTGTMPSIELSGPWHYYQEFHYRHGMILPEAKVPEIEVKSGLILSVPVVIAPDSAGEVNLTVRAPSGWKVTNGAGRLRLPKENKTALNVEIATPEMSKEELKNAQPVEVVVGLSGNGTVSEVRLRVLLKASALPQ